MQMIDVLKRLAALDANNPNVVNPASPKKKQQVHEDTSVAECGPMGMMGSMGMDRPSTPASFSINASAADGQEVSQMLRDIMNLAGMSHEKPGGDMDSDKEPVTGSNMPAPSENELMRSMLDTMNDPEDEGMFGAGAGAIGGSELGGAAGAALGNMVAPGIGGAIGGMAGKVIGGGVGAKVGDAATGENGSGAGTVPGDVGSMADHVRDMADELADTDKEELGLESWDNTPANPTSVPEFDSNKFAYNPNAGGVNKGVTNQPTATLEDQLYNDYKKFVSEEKAKTMSRAAKGYEKYGKKGMKALADAGKAGKDLEPVRAKYNKYD